MFIGHGGAQGSRAALAAPCGTEALATRLYDAVDGLLPYSQTIVYSRSRMASVATEGRDNIDYRVALTEGIGPAVRLATIALGFPGIQEDGRPQEMRVCLSLDEDNRTRLSTEAGEANDLRPLVARIALGRYVRPVVEELAHDVCHALGSGSEIPAAAFTAYWQAINAAYDAMHHPVDFQTVFSGRFGGRAARLTHTSMAFPPRELPRAEHVTPFRSIITGVEGMFAFRRVVCKGLVTASDFIDIGKHQARDATPRDIDRVCTILEQMQEAAFSALKQP